MSQADEPTATPDATGNHYLTEFDFALDGLPQQRYGLKAGFERGRLHRIYHAGSVGYVVEPTGTVDFNYSNLVQGSKTLPRNAEEHLASQAGICGRQVMTFREILDRLGVRQRRITVTLKCAARAR